MKVLNYIILSLLLLMSSCGIFSKSESHPGLGNDGQGFAGGESDISLTEKRLRLALAELRSGFDTAFLGNVRIYNVPYLPTLPDALTYILANLTAAQTALIRSFVLGDQNVVTDVISLFPKISVDLTDQVLQVQGYSGALVQVPARTPFGSTGDIEINSTYLDSVSDNLYLVMALLTHEFGHKVQWQGKYLNDVQDVGDASGNSVFYGGTRGGGAQFLNAVGAAVTQYFLFHNVLIPVLFPANAGSCNPDDLHTLLDNAPVFLSGTVAFPETSQQLHAALNAAFVAGSDFTLNLWVNPASISSTPQVLLSDTDNAFLSQGGNIVYNDGLEILIAGNGNVIAGAGGTSRFDSGLALSIGAYHLLTLKNAGSSLTLYVDGVKGKQISNTQFALVETTNDSTTFGEPTSALQGVELPFSGQIGEASFFPSALSDSDIASLYSCGAQ